MLVALVGATLVDCTVLGAGVGLGVSAATPGPYEPLAEAPRGGFSRAQFQAQVSIARGDHVLVNRWDKPDLVGRYLGLSPDEDPADASSELLIAVGGRTRHVPLSEVRGVQLERLGNGAVVGAIIGLVLDVAAVLVVRETYPRF